MGATTLLALGGLAVAAGVCGAGQHAVLGGHPTLTTATFVGRHFFFHRSRAKYLGVAKRNQDRALGVYGVVAADGNGAQGIVGALKTRRNGAHGGVRNLVL